MIRYTLSATLFAANLALLAWIMLRQPVSNGRTFLAVLAAVAASAVARYFRSTGEVGWRAQLDPVVTLTFLVVFDLVLFGLPSIGMR